MPNLHYVDFCEMFVGYLLPQSNAMGPKNYQKKLQAQFYPEDPLGVVTPMPKYGQKSTFDRKVLE